MRLFAFILPFLLCACSPVSVPDTFPVPTREGEALERSLSLQKTVRALVEGGGNLGRLAAVESRAAELGLDALARTEAIDWFSLQHNLLIEIPGESPETIYIVAHYDKTDANPLKFLSLLLNGALDEAVSFSFLSDGAIDNATGVAVALELASVLHAAGPHHYSYRFLFPGSEESGLRGSRAHVARLSPEELDAMSFAVNIDTVGVAFAPNCVTEGVSDPALLEEAMEVAEDLGVELGEEPLLEGLASDYVPFRASSFRGDFLLGLQNNLVGGLLPQRSWFTPSRSTPVINFSACDLVSFGDYLFNVLQLPLARLHGPRDNLSQVDPERLYEQYEIVHKMLEGYDDAPSETRAFLYGHRHKTIRR